MFLSLNADGRGDDANEAEEEDKDYDDPFSAPGSPPHGGEKRKIQSVSFLFKRVNFLQF